MKKKSNINGWKRYAIKVTNYIEMEYGGLDSDLNMIKASITDHEKNTVTNVIRLHYITNDSVNNAANGIIDYLRKNRAEKENK